MLRRTRRAPSACSWCHHRKVRCDASILGSPCTRCRQDGRKECILRPKNPPQPQQPAYPQSSIDQPPEQSNQYNTHDINTHDIDQRSSPIGHRSRSNNISIEEYAFLDSVDSLHLPTEDMEFLTSKDCFILPAPAAMDQFICQFFKRVHPLVPVIDEAEFYIIYRTEDLPTRKISLFVLQAMLFASSAFVPLATLCECGFKSRRDARKQLYNRAKSLFELKVEKNFFHISQGAVLLTHYTSADDPQSGSIWVTRAIENATRLDALPPLSPQNVPMSLKKRLWWSILLRDRSLCIGLRRRPQVTQIPLQGWSDWLGDEDFQEEMHHSEVYSYETKRKLLSALQQQCRLAVLLTDLACVVFSHPNSSKHRLSMSEFQNLMSRIQTIKRSLRTWENPPLVYDASLSEGHDAIATSIYLTHMYFHAANVDLAQFTAFILEENSFYAADSYSQLITETGNDLQDAIEGLSIVMEHFSTNGHVDSFPLSVLAYVSMPLVLAAIDLKLSPSRTEMRRRQKRLDSLSLIIRHSEPLYDITDLVAVGTNHILQLAYTTTKNLYFGGNEPQRSFEDITADYHPSRVSVKSAPSPNESSKIQRPRTWQEAFVRCPRAYLLISTSVDYNLSVGRLPSADSLPDIVRDLPAMGKIARLPWTSDIDLSQLEIGPRFQGYRSSIDDRRYPESMSAELELERRSICFNTQPIDHLSPITVSDSSTAISSAEDQPDQSNGGINQDLSHIAPINLDYMDFIDTNPDPKFGITPLMDHASPYVQTDRLEYPMENKHGMPLPGYIETVDSHIFKSFFHEAFEQNWGIS